MTNRRTMRARIPIPIQRLHPAAVRRGHQQSVRLDVLPPEPLGPEARVRQAGGPDDRASYTCCCGYVFSAQVSASVECPHCGAGQAW